MDGRHGFPRLGVNLVVPQPAARPLGLPIDPALVDNSANMADELASAVPAMSPAVPVIPARPAIPAAPAVPLGPPGPFAAVSFIAAAPAPAAFPVLAPSAAFEQALALAILPEGSGAQTIAPTTPSQGAVLANMVCVTRSASAVAAANVAAADAANAAAANTNVAAPPLAAAPLVAPPAVAIPGNNNLGTIREMFVSVMETDILVNTRKFRRYDAEKRQSTIDTVLKKVPEAILNSPAQRRTGLYPAAYDHFSDGKPTNLLGLIVQIGGDLKSAGPPGPPQPLDPKREITGGNVTCCASIPAAGELSGSFTACPQVFWGGCVVPTVAMRTSREKPAWIKGSRGSCANHMNHSLWYKCVHADMVRRQTRQDSESEVKKRQPPGSRGGGGGGGIGGAATQIQVA